MPSIRSADKFSTWADSLVPNPGRGSSDYTYPGIFIGLAIIYPPRKNFQDSRSTANSSSLSTTLPEMEIRLIWISWGSQSRPNFSSTLARLTVKRPGSVDLDHRGIVVDGGVGIIFGNRFNDRPCVLVVLQGQVNHVVRHLDSSALAVSRSEIRPHFFLARVRKSSWVPASPLRLRRQNMFGQRGQCARDPSGPASCPLFQQGLVGGGFGGGGLEHHVGEAVVSANQSTMNSVSIARAEPPFSEMRVSKRS